MLSTQQQTCFKDLSNFSLKVIFLLSIGPKKENTRPSEKGSTKSIFQKTACALEWKAHRSNLDEYQTAKIEAFTFCVCVQKMADFVYIYFVRTY